MQCIQTQLANARLKQVGKNFMLIIENVNTMSDVEWILDGMTLKETNQV
jgi:transcription-repair coupling factor (superfamily II helicase)